ncbi:hypothetical protein [Photobacterium nomapromontoriensis]
MKEMVADQNFFDQGGLINFSNERRIRVNSEGKKAMNQKQQRQGNILAFA